MLFISSSKTLLLLPPEPKTMGFLTNVHSNKSFTYTLMFMQFVNLLRATGKSNRTAARETIGIETRASVRISKGASIFSQAEQDWIWARYQFFQPEGSTVNCTELDLSKVCGFF